MTTSGQAGELQPRAGIASSRVWLSVSVRLAVALAFADASIVVLGLPQIVERLHTSISHVTWVITAYNLALIAGTLAILPVAGRLASKRALIAGLALFGVASVGAGASGSLRVLVVFRSLQGAGGALLLCASLPLFLSGARRAEASLGGWATAAAFGAAVGPAAGGLLTQVFDWRAIFFAQAPVAAIAAAAVAFGSFRTLHSGEVEMDPARSHAAAGRLHPSAANVALLFLSAGLIGALFLSTVLLINAWQLSPLGAAAVLSTLPLMTLLAERAIRGRSPVGLGAAGAVTLAGGLIILAFAGDRHVVLAVVALGLCGSGLGMAFPSLTEAALRTPGAPVARAARTVAARDLGLVVGLLILTPVFVHELSVAPKQAFPVVAGEVLRVRIPDDLKLRLASGLLAANANASQSRLPDIGPAFVQVEARSDAPTRTQLASLRVRTQSIIRRAATRSFRRPLIYSALLALISLPFLALGQRRARRARAHGPD